MSTASASVQACCCINRCLCHGLGSHVQWACSCRALDRALAAVAYQLPWVASSIACSAPLQTTATRQACTGPYRQQCDHCRMPELIRHLFFWSQKHLRSLWGRSYPRRAQSCCQRALTSARPSGRMATPPWDGPADWEMVRRHSGRSICLPEHIPLLAVFLPDQGDPWHERTGTQLASGPMQICISPNELSRTDTVQSQGGQGAGPLGGVVLAQSDLVLWTNALATAPPWQIPLRRDLLSQRGGTCWHPHPDLWNLHVWSLDGTQSF